MRKSNGAKQPVEETDMSEGDCKRLLAQFRKENERLQDLIARKEVAHESEKNRLRAEHKAAMEKAVNRPIYEITTMPVRDV